MVKNEYIKIKNGKKEYVRKNKILDAYLKKIVDRQTGTLDIENTGIYQTDNQFSLNHILFKLDSPIEGIDNIGKNELQLLSENENVDGLNITNNGDNSLSLEGTAKKIEGETVQGTSFTLTDAEANKQASIIELKGNTSQEGTPTPSSPVEVKTVTGDNNVVVSNKNILDLTKHTNTLATNTTIIDSNTIQCEATGNWQGRVIVPLQLRKNTQYTISAKTEGNATRCLVSRINGTINGTTTAVVSNQYYDYFKNGYTFNSGNYDKWEMDFYVTGNNSPTGTLKVEELQIEENNRKTTYIAHQSNTYRVDLRRQEFISFTKRNA